MNRKPGKNFVEGKDTFLAQKKTLSDLKNADILTETEYNKKLQILDKNEQDSISEKIIEQIDIQAKDEIEPLVTKLSKLLNSGIISNEEFETKKGKLFSDKKQYLIDNPYWVALFNFIFHPSELIPGWMDILYPN